MSRSRYTLKIEGPDGNTLESKLPSVTEILDKVLAKNGLPDWYYKQAVSGFGTLLGKYGATLPPDVRSIHSLMRSEGLSPYATRDAAAAQGLAIHKAVESLAKGGKPERFPELTSWWKDKKLKKSSVLAAEGLVYSGKHGYAGTVDLVYQDPETGDTVLADIKTGNLRDSHELQLELYRWAWEEQESNPISRMELIQVPRDNSPVKTKPVLITSGLTQAASGILETYKWLV